jgi:hypothetical protein
VALISATRIATFVLLGHGTERGTRLYDLVMLGAGGGGGGGGGAPPPPPPPAP